MAIPLRIRWAEWVAGVFVLGAFVAILGALVMLTSARGGLGGEPIYVVHLGHAHGIAPGGPVKMLGIPIGTIDEVEITEDNRVRATLRVDAQFADRLRADSVARVEASLGLESMLGGVGFVVSPGSAGAAIIEPGGELPAVEPGNLSELLPGVVDDPLFSDAETLLHNLMVVSQLLADEQSDLRKLVRSADTTLTLVNEGNGTVGKLLRDDGELYTRVLGTLDEVDATLERVQETMGASGKLMTRAGKVMDGAGDVLDDAGSVMRSADMTVADMGTTFGKMGPVLDDAGDAMKDLDSAVVAFAETTEKLGDLIAQMDRVVADMATVTAAAKKVWPIRRHVRKAEAGK